MKHLDTELHVATTTLKSLELSESKVCAVQGVAKKYPRDIFQQFSQQSRGIGLSKQILPA